MATIFGSDGELDLGGFRANLERYATSALDGIVVLGSNGEYPLLDRSEKLRLIETAVNTIDGRRVVMAGTGAESTRETIALTREAADLGIDYAIVITPHYYKPRYDQAAYVAHYRAVADASPVPIIIYVMAAYTGVDPAASLVHELSEHPNIAGIKDSGGNAPKVGEMIAVADSGLWRSWPGPRASSIPRSALARPGASWLWRTSRRVSVKMSNARFAPMITRPRGPCSCGSWHRMRQSRRALASPG